ncbi:MAG: PepSY domain-containing protein [Acidobacteriota bacterium]|nr:PepSY domain-containing protein [Acidobacteriota bacterium]
MAKVPGETVQSAELEIEHGKLVWSFDIKDSKAPDVIEVQVDAKTGHIVSKKTESPAEQAKEAKADKLVKS